MRYFSERPPILLTPLFHFFQPTPPKKIRPCLVSLADLPEKHKNWIYGSGVTLCVNEQSTQNHTYTQTHNTNLMTLELVRYLLGCKMQEE